MYAISLPDCHHSGCQTVKQKAQLPQRNSASATHDYLGWSADLL